jgi:hypothetical protein
LLFDKKSRCTLEKHAFKTEKNTLKRKISLKKTFLWFILAPIEYMKRRVEIMSQSNTTKNGQERVTTNRDNIRHLEYFMNGQWRHSHRCKEFTNKECTVKVQTSSK